MNQRECATVNSKSFHHQHHNSKQKPFGEVEFSIEAYWTWIACDSIIYLLLNKNKALHTFLCWRWNSQDFFWLRWNKQTTLYFNILILSFIISYVSSVFQKVFSIVVSALKKRKGMLLLKFLISWKNTRFFPIFTEFVICLYQVETLYLISFVLALWRLKTDIQTKFHYNDIGF